MSTAGTSTDGFVTGGFSAPTTRLATTEEYDGSSWTEVGDMPSVKADHAGDGTGSVAWGAGGYTPSYSNATVEWDKAVAASSFTSS